MLSIHILGGLLQGRLPWTIPSITVFASRWSLHSTDVPRVSTFFGYQVDYGMVAFNSVPYAFVGGSLSDTLSVFSCNTTTSKTPSVFLYHSF